MGYIAKDKEINLLFAESERMYHRLIENLRLGVYMADAQGNLFYVNSAFAQILGYPGRDELLGMNLAQQLYVDPQDRQVFLKEMQKFGFVRDYVVRNKRKDGSIVTLSVTSNFIRNAKDQVIGVEGVVEDITQRSVLEEKTKMLSRAVEQTADHVMITDKHGVILYVNPAFEETTGYALHEIQGRTPNILKSGKHGSDYYQKLWTTIMAGKVFRAQTINKNKKGDLYVADQIISPIKNDSGEITHFVAAWTDITEKAYLEEQLRGEKHKLEEIVGFDEKVSSIRKLDRLFDFVVKKAAEILDASKCSIMLVDYQRGELCVKGARGFKDDIFKQKVKVGELLTGWVAQQGTPLLVKNVEQDPQWLEAARFLYLGSSFISVPIKMSGQVIGVINVAEKGKSRNEAFNETDLKVLDSISREVAVALENLKLYKELHFLTITDPLTHLYNFRYFSRTMDYEIKRTKRHLRPLGLMILDIDNFKPYNDEFGHPEGNKLLKGIAQIFLKSVREIDVVCRYGGDEFAIILPEVSRPEAEAVAERLRAAVENAKFERKITISIGLCMYVPNTDRHELTSRADRALYQAKREGKNRVCVFG